MKQVETKVKAATLGAGAGVALAEFINWALDTYALTPNVTGDLPAPVSGVVLVVVAAGLAWLAGYRAKHTSRFARGGVIAGPRLKDADSISVKLTPGDHLLSAGDVAAFVREHGGKNFPR